jgi:hypothetical protein
VGDCTTDDFVPRTHILAPRRGGRLNSTCFYSAPAGRSAGPVIAGWFDRDVMLSRIGSFFSTWFNITGSSP